MQHNKGFTRPLISKHCIAKTTWIPKANFTCPSCNRQITNQNRWDIHHQCLHVELTCKRLKPFIGNICSECKVTFENSNDAFHTYLKREQREKDIRKQTKERKRKQYLEIRNGHPKEGYFYFMVEVRKKDDQVILLQMYSKCGQNQMQISGTDQTISEFFAARKKDYKIGKITPITPYQNFPNIDLSEFIKAFLEERAAKANNNTEENNANNNSNK